MLLQQIEKLTGSGAALGFVPTMGALHEGHLSLVEASKTKDQLTVASIFVNPVQFNNQKDFEKYPVTLEKDIELLYKAGCDIVFHPDVAEVYPPWLSIPSYFDLGYLESILEGKSRPGHFQGVCKVMYRLLTVIRPRHLFLGQKDFQQCMVIKRLIQLMKSETILVECPTLRGKDGLAMSSRNLRLSADERENATGIWEALQYLKANVVPGKINPIIEQSKPILLNKKFNIDYIAVADASTLSILDTWDGEQKIVALIAAFQNEIRLIDNLLLN